MKNDDEIRYGDVKRRYKQISNFDYFDDIESFEDKLDSELLSSIYKDFVEKYIQKCLDIDNKIFESCEASEGIYKFSVSDDNYSINLEADLINNKFDNTKLRSEYLMRLIVSKVSIFFIDMYWQKHLQKMDDLKKSVQNAYYEQNDPLIVFKFESYELFTEMMVAINCDIVKFIFHCSVGWFEKYEDDVHVVINDVSRKESSESFRKKIKSILNG